MIRSGKHGSFLGCSHYLGCDYIRPLKSQTDGYIVEMLGGRGRPPCGAVMVLRQGHFGMFIGCSRYPECEHTELIDKPDETAITCPQHGRGHLVQRRSRFGKTSYSCDRYSDYQLAINSKPVAGGCPERHYPPLIEKKMAQGLRRFRASKQCGGLIPAE